MPYYIRTVKETRTLVEIYDVPNEKTLHYIEKDDRKPALTMQPEDSLREVVEEFRPLTTTEQIIFQSKMPAIWERRNGDDD